MRKLWVILRSASKRRISGVPTTYACLEKSENSFMLIHLLSLSLLVMVFLQYNMANETLFASKQIKTDLYNTNGC